MPRERRNKCWYVERQRHENILLCRVFENPGVLIAKYIKFMYRNCVIALKTYDHQQDIYPQDKNIATYFPSHDNYALHVRVINGDAFSRKWYFGSETVVNVKCQFRFVVSQWQRFKVLSKLIYVSSIFCGEMNFFTLHVPRAISLLPSHAVFLVIHNSAAPCLNYTPFFDKVLSRSYTCSRNINYF